MKILVTPTSFQKPENAKARRMLEEFADEVVYNDLGVPLAGEELIERLAGADGYIAGVDYITAEVVAAMPQQLKVISRYGAGVDRVDLEACWSRGVTVTNTPGVNSTAVCELAFGLLLSCARKIPALNKDTKSGGWLRADGVELEGRTLGIAGLGAIGKKLAIRAQAFGMRVAAYDPWMDEAFTRQHGIECMELDELVRAADVLSLHVPLTEETYHMIDSKRISSMKQGAIIINTARGGLVDEAAAAKAIREGRLWGIGLDAFEKEPPDDSPLIGLENAVLTPHTGAHTDSAITNMGLLAVENLIAVLQGEVCGNVVSP